MKEGFNLEMNDPQFENSLKQNYKKNSKQYNNFETIVKKKKLVEYLCTDGSLDGTKMQDDWFSEINADIFLSHSHADKDIAIALANWITEKKFGLTVFIDSCVWGHSDDLLKQIDDKYCFHGSTYSYCERNISTAHVHMMLSTALAKMIDRTDCIIFLNTPNSVSLKDNIKKNSFRSKSPWIYSEIALTQIVQKKKAIDEHRIAKKIIQALESMRDIYKKFSLNESAQLEIQYLLDFKHLFGITCKHLRKWEQLSLKFDYKEKKDSLALLYCLYGRYQLGKKIL